MAIFSRRDVQAAVDSLAGALTAKQLEDLVRRLNGEPSGSLATEWEVVVTAAFSKCGRIGYEKEFGGESRPDIFFQLGESGRLEFVADIRAISDTYAHSENPYDDFNAAIRRFLRKLGHSSAGLHIDVGDEERGEYGNRRVQLALPAKGDMDRFVKSELREFLTRIAREPDKDESLSFNSQGVRFTIRYNSKEKRFSGGGHLSYTVPYSIQRNPLARALEEKGKQLGKSGYDRAKGIVICDAGCDSLNERSRAAGAFGCQEIIEEFFRKRSSILWVLVIQVEEAHGVLYRSNISLKSKLYWNPQREKRLFSEIKEAHMRMLAHLPHPESTPANAMHWLNGRNKNVGRTMGGYTMRDKTIKISARGLTDLLAERVTLQEFLEDHSFKPHPREPKAFSFQFFAHQVNSGHTLKSAFVERDEHKDDDWLVLEYDGPDPAISPYRVSKSLANE